MKEIEELQEFLDSAKGNLAITVNGSVPHIFGNVNDSGAILAAFSMLKMIEHTQGHDIQEVMKMLLNLNDLLGYHIAGEIGEEDIEYGNN